MHASFESKAGIDIVARHRGDDFFDTAGGGFAHGHDFDLPALGLGVSAIHAEQVRGEESRLLAPGATANLENGVTLVIRILGQEQKVDGRF